MTRTGTGPRELGAAPRPGPACAEDECAAAAARGSPFTSCTHTLSHVSSRSTLSCGPKQRQERGFGAPHGAPEVRRGTRAPRGFAGPLGEDSGTMGILR